MKRRALTDPCNFQTQSVKMESKSFTLSRIFVCCANVIFLVSHGSGTKHISRRSQCSSGVKTRSLDFQISGFALMSLGALLLADDKRILLSRLLGPGDIHPEQPLFYYLAFAIVGLGFLITLTGLLGCWATCLYNRCVTISVRHPLLKKKS